MLLLFVYSTVTLIGLVVQAITLYHVGLRALPHLTPKRVIVSLLASPWIGIAALVLAAFGHFQDGLDVACQAAIDEADREGW